MTKKIRKAIIPAAGLGTRFLPATKAQPKEMLPIVDKPTIQYISKRAFHSPQRPTGVNEHMSAHLGGYILQHFFDKCSLN